MGSYRYDFQTSGFLILDRVFGDIIDPPQKIRLRMILRQIFTT